MTNKRVLKNAEENSQHTRQRQPRFDFVSVSTANYEVT